MLRRAPARACQCANVVWPDVVQSSANPAAVIKVDALSNSCRVPHPRQMDGAIAVRSVDSARISIDIDYRCIIVHQFYISKESRYNYKYTTGPSAYTADPESEGDAAMPARIGTSRPSAPSARWYCSRGISQSSLWRKGRSAQLAPWYRTRHDTGSLSRRFTMRALWSA